MAADGAVKLRKGHRVKNVSFPHVSKRPCGALNTLPEQSRRSGKLRRGHITSNWQIAWVLQPDAIHGPAFYSHLLFPLFIFSTVEPGLLSGDLTFTLYIGYELHATKNYRESVKAFTTCLK